MRQDLRYAFRRVIRTPGFSIAVIVILAVGIGTASTMTSVLYALAYRPLSLPTPGTLVNVTTIDQRGSTRITPLITLDQLHRADLVADGWCAQNAIVETASANGRMQRGWTDLMAGNCPTVIGLEPALGRWFTPEEAPFTGKGQPVAVITDRYWESAFDRAPNVLGQTIQIQDVTATIIGVMPPAFTGFDVDNASDFVMPFNAHRQASGGLRYLGRLKPQATVEQLRAQIDRLWPGVLEAVLPAGPTREQSLKEWRGTADAIPQGFSILRRLYATPIRNLSLLTLALLALVCANIAALLVGRFTSRAHEISAMRALGAPTTRLIGSMTAEASLLALGGTLLSIPLAYAASGAFASLFPTGNTAWTLATTPDAMVFAAIAAGLILVIGAISAVPIALALRQSPLGAHGRTVSRNTSRWARAMLVSQIAVTITLLFTCALVVRSFYGLITVDRGFRADHLLSLRLGAVPGGYKGLDETTYYPALVQRLAALPGVQAAGLARYFGTINAQMTEQPVGYSEAGDNTASAASDFISPGFFEAIGAPLLSGRDVAWTDVPTTPLVAIVSESVARQLNPSGDVVGRTIRFGSTPKYARVQVVGVVGNFSIGNLRKTKERMIYFPSVQVGETASASAHLHTSGPPLLMAQTASAAVAALGREHATGAYSDMLFGNSIVAERMGAAVSAAVAVLALIISCIGVFALLSHSVQLRTREIGIRVAIGASPARISTLILRDTVIIIGSGLVFGIPAALATTTLVRSLLYDVKANDGFLLTVSVTVLAASAALAAVRPTWRAVRVDPAIVLRSE